MKINLSRSMEKCIDEIKLESLELIEDIPSAQVLKLKRKPTKNKLFEFHIINLFNKPFIKLFINEKFYASYFISEGKWFEER